MVERHRDLPGKDRRALSVLPWEKPRLCSSPRLGEASSGGSSSPPPPPGLPLVAQELPTWGAGGERLRPCASSLSSQGPLHHLPS